MQEQIEAYKAKKKAIDAAPIKKVAEAKARKKRKVSTVSTLFSASGHQCMIHGKKGNGNLGNHLGKMGNGK